MKTSVSSRGHKEFSVFGAGPAPREVLFEERTFVPLRAEEIALAVLHSAWTQLSMFHVSHVVVVH